MNAAYNIGWELATARYSARGEGRSSWWSGYFEVRARNMVITTIGGRFNRLRVARLMREGYVDGKSRSVFKANCQAPF
jgi:hypothetical protein